MPTPLKIILGSQNYSSWSVRPWIVLKQLGVPFEQVVIALDQPTTQGEIARYSPSGRVPVLIDGDVTVWDSLAICEYLAEKFPDRGLWPKDAGARTVARSISAEMHSGFGAMREALPMNIRASIPKTGLLPGVTQDITRIQGLWTDCRRRFGASGPFLFGAFSIADAFYVPVVSRFRTYGVTLEGVPATYADTLWNLPATQEWVAAARAEQHRVAKYETRPT
jgi:glutathione S-transferase